MPTPKKGARLGGSPANQRRILSNLAAALFEHGAIKTTDAKAKVLRPYVEKLITRAKAGSVNDRRLVLKQVPHKDIVNYLFNELAPKFENRSGGYTRIIKLENRAGDNAPMSQISLVLEETVTTEATRAARAAASKQAKAAESSEAPEVEADEATDAQAADEASEAEQPVSTDEPAEGSDDAEKVEVEEKNEEK